jgi:hypothetical protein
MCCIYVGGGISFSVMICTADAVPKVSEVFCSSIFKVQVVVV